VSATVKTIAAALVWQVALAAGAAAQQPPRITNATVRAQPAGSPLVPLFQRIVSAQTGVAWIGYSVPAAEGHTMCCNGSGSTWGDGCCSACRLEPSSSAAGVATASSGAATAGPVQLEGTTRMVVLFRVADRRIERIRVFSEACELDAGGRPVEWLDNVNPLDSVSLLETLATSDAAASPRERTSSSALLAIALHGGAARDSATETLVRLARTASATRTRGDALFWLAQMAGTKAAAAITERIEQDPDTDVKKKAVFALSQLPKDEGVPLLINVARTNANPAVRKQAMFWLGQSKDPRAIDFFAEILK
jgi:hypothetical protein